MLKKRIGFILLALGSAVIRCLLAWPVPIAPVAWQAPPNPGYTGAFARNEGLRDLEMLAIGTEHGPEEVVLDGQQRISASTWEGWIARLEADGSQPKNWVHTGLSNLNFPNGVAVSSDQTCLLVNETGTYRILRYWFAGPKAGMAEPFVE